MGSRPKQLRNAGLNQFDDPRHSSFGIIGLHKIKIAVTVGLGEIGNGALVDPVRGGDNPALRGLAKYLGQPHDRHGAGSDDIGQHLTRADRGELIDVADDQQRGIIGDRLHQRLHQHDVHHRGLIDDQQLAFERVIAAAFEPSCLGIHLEQPVNRLGLEPGRFGHAFGGSTGWCAQRQGHPLGG